MRGAARIEKELVEFEELKHSNENDNLYYSLLKQEKVLDLTGSEKLILKFQLKGEPDTIYHGESWVLQMVIESTAQTNTYPFSTYPFSAPSTTFIGTPPLHQHVYSNGHICLSILYEDWSPSFSLRILILQIMRMLSVSKSKLPPKDDFDYCVSHPYGSDPRSTPFLFHNIF